MKNEFDSLTKQISELKTECETLRIRNEVLEYHLQRAERKARDLQREADELLAVMGIRATSVVQSEYDPPAPLGWGKGKDE